MSVSGYYDKAIKDMGAFNYDISVPGGPSFPINDSVIVAKGDRVFHRFKILPALELLDSFTALRPEDLQEPYVDDNIIPLDAHRWIYVYERLDKAQFTRYTEDQGKTWVTIPNIFTVPENHLFYHYYFERSNIQVVGSRVWIFCAQISDTLYRSNDYGKTWQRLVLPEWLKPGLIKSFAFADRNVGLMTCYNDGKLARTMDGGETWSTEGLQRPDNKNAFIAYAPPTANKDGLFFIYGSNGCHYSSSNGQWWKWMDGYQHDYLSFYDAEHGLSFYEPSLSVFKYRFFQNTLRTDVRQTQETEVLVYPNPASTYIKMDVEQLTPVEIYDMMGRCVCKCEVSREIPIDISNLKPSRYILHLTEIGGQYVFSVN